MILTPAGERLLESARRVLEQLRQTEDAIRQLAAQRDGVLRISTECYTCYHWLPSVLTTFRAKFPRVDVRIDVDATSRPMQALLEGQIDVALVTSKVRDRRLVVRPLFKDELVLVARPDHRLAGRPHVKPIDFAEENLLVYSPVEETTIYREVLKPAGVMPAGVQQVQLTEAILELVKAGLGISVMARWAVQPQVAAGTVVAVPVTARGFIRQWHAAISKSIANAPYLVEFLTLVSRQAIPVRLGEPAAAPDGLAAHSSVDGWSRAEAASSQQPSY